MFQCGNRLLPQTVHPEGIHKRFCFVANCVSRIEPTRHEDPEYVAQKSVISFGVRAVDDRMCTDDHDCLSPLCKLPNAAHHLPAEAGDARYSRSGDAAVRAQVLTHAA